MEQREERQVLLELSRVVTEVDRRSSLVRVDVSFGSFLCAREKEHPSRVQPCIIDGLSCVSQVKSEIAALRYIFTTDPS